MFCCVLCPERTEATAGQTFGFGRSQNQAKESPDGWCKSCSKYRNAHTSTRSSMQHRQFFSSGCFFVTLISEQCEWILLSAKSLSSLLFREGKAVRALPSLHLKSHKSWLTHRITQHEVDHFISCDLQTVTWAALGNLDFPFLDFLALTSSFFWHLDCFSLKIHHTKTPHLVIYGVIVSLNGNKFRGAQENKREN